MQDLASAVLSRRYEEQLFQQVSSHNRVVPALVITGFLGSGKTTLLQHLLATCGGEMKLGVLVNEAASLDVDSQLLAAQQANAAAGIKAARLAGGCACCAVAGDLQAALAELACSPNYQHLDYLLLETSGVADAEPLAASLAAAGFRLAGVVVLVDAEAGLGVLTQDVAVAQAANCCRVGFRLAGVLVDAEAGLEVLTQDVAVAQVRAADVAVLSKCDLATLAGVAAVEDRLQQLAPGLRMLRARFGQVPPEALLDIDLPDEEQQQQQQQDGSSGPQAAPASVQGEIGFLSHEPVVAGTASRRARQPGIASIRRANAAAAANGTGSQQQQQQQQQQQAGLPHHPHSHPQQRSQHSHFASVAFTAGAPLCMACFQCFTAARLLTAQGRPAEQCSL
ncbi:hypothetical protein OEZ85_004344 [Tetradesmus obliquus]|uniref:CobW/HypB/UreG nucleotide-binding domain-containing protein n=1 Tax=Tetradesmus obliquus TaxID=3088 RepID=A0ABY8UKV6_TETOB|nr:hypothetical protein OEZ85_004344 [Tetradesmus obliquus]